MEVKQRLGCICAATAIAIGGAWPANAESLLAVANRDDASVGVYQVLGARVRLAKKIAIESNPKELCLSPDGKLAFASGGGPRPGVAVIDLNARTLVASVHGAELKDPDGCAVSPDGRKLYVADSGANAVHVYAVDGSKLLTSIPVGLEPRRVFFTKDGQTALISNASSNSLSAIDWRTDRVKRQIKTPHEPRTMSYSVDGKFLMVTMIEDDSIAYFDADTYELDQEVGVAMAPQRVLQSPDGRFVFVVGFVDGIVGVCDTRPGGVSRRQVQTIRVGGHPWGLAMSPDGKFLYVTSRDENDVEVIDVDLMKMTIKYPAGAAPMDIVLRK